MNVFLLYFVLIFSYGKYATGISQKIRDNVINYFNNAKVREFEEKWEVHRISAESALELAIKETFGKPALNLYVKSVDDTHKVSEGYLIHDRVVYVLFKDLALSRYPYLRNPRVWFPLASNVLRVEATVSKTLIHAEYYLFRNYSDLVYPADKQEELNSSPFVRQQVQSKGQATIIAEHCVLHGETIATLHGLNVNLGYNNFELDNCKFSVEISAPGLGSPPVIVPYFSEEQGMELSRMLMMTLHDELMPKLQAAVHSTVNTTAILGSLLPEVRQIQRETLRLTSDYATKVIRSLNKITTLKNVASQEWKDHRITWSEQKDAKVTKNEITLKNMMLSGLDSAYTGRSGGFVKTDAIKIYEDLRFHGLQIHGIAYINMGEIKNQFKFSTEMQDIMCKTVIEISKIEAENSPQKPMALPKEVQRLQMSGWRNLEIFGPPSPAIDTYAWMTGVLLNRAPVVIVKHMSKHMKDAIRHAEQPLASLTIPDSREIGSKEVPANPNPSKEAQDPYHYQDNPAKFEDSAENMSNDVISDDGSSGHPRFNTKPNIKLVAQSFKKTLLEKVDGGDILVEKLKSKSFDDMYYESLKKYMDENLTDDEKAKLSNVDFEQMWTEIREELMSYFDTDGRLPSNWDKDEHSGNIKLVHKSNSEKMFKKPLFGNDDASDDGSNGKTKFGYPNSPSVFDGKTNFKELTEIFQQIVREQEGAGHLKEKLKRQDKTESFYDMMFESFKKELVKWFGPDLEATLSTVNYDQLYEIYENLLKELHGKADGADDEPSSGKHKSKPEKMFKRPLFGKDDASGDDPSSGKQKLVHRSKHEKMFKRPLLGKDDASDDDPSSGKQKLAHKSKPEKMFKRPLFGKDDASGDDPSSGKQKLVHRSKHEKMFKRPLFGNDDASGDDPSSGKQKLVHKSKPEKMFKRPLFEKDDASGDDPSSEKQKLVHKSKPEKMFKRPLFGNDDASDK